MSQTSYAVDMAIGLEGMQADAMVASDVGSFSNAVAVLDGKFVARDTADGSCKAPAAATDVTDLKDGLGVVLHAHNREADAAGAAEWPVKSAVPVMLKGRVLVKVEEAVTPDSDVYVRFASGAGGTVLGSFRASADTATAALLPNTRARYRSSASANGLAILELL